MGLFPCGEELHDDSVSGPTQASQQARRSKGFIVRMCGKDDERGPAGMASTRSAGSPWTPASRQELSRVPGSRWSKPIMVVPRAKFRAQSGFIAGTVVLTDVDGEISVGFGEASVTCQRCRSRDFATQVLDPANS